MGGGDPEAPESGGAVIRDPDEPEESESGKIRRKDLIAHAEACIKAKSEIEEFSRINDKGFRLQGYLIRPEKQSDVYVFASHGYRCYGKNGAHLRNL